jgi:hypothetical protein
MRGREWLRRCGKYVANGNSHFLLGNLKHLVAKPAATSPTPPQPPLRRLEIPPAPASAPQTGRPDGGLSDALSGDFVPGR